LAFIVQLSFPDPSILPILQIPLLRAEVDADQCDFLVTPLVLLSVTPILYLPYGRLGALVALIGD
jgi:hypothetical protein